MILYIDTSDQSKINLFLEKDSKIIGKKNIQARRQQAEKLLPAISQLLVKTKVNPRDLKKIKVEHRGNSFTALRIGVLTANALAYALSIPVETIINNKKNLKVFKNFNVVVPDYQKELIIKKSKNIKI